jgi:hypothetical protein
MCRAWPLPRNGNYAYDTHTLNLLAGPARSGRVAAQWLRTNLLWVRAVSNACSLIPVVGQGAADVGGPLLADAVGRHVQRRQRRVDAQRVRQGLRPGGGEWGWGEWGVEGGASQPMNRAPRGLTAVRRVRRRSEGTVLRIGG